MKEPIDEPRKPEVPPLEDPALPDSYEPSPGETPPDSQDTPEKKKEADKAAF